MPVMQHSCSATVTASCRPRGNGTDAVTNELRVSNYFAAGRESAMPAMAHKEMAHRLSYLPHVSRYAVQHLTPDPATMSTMLSCSAARVPEEPATQRELDRLTKNIKI